MYIVYLKSYYYDASCIVMTVVVIYIWLPIVTSNNFFLYVPIYFILCSQVNFKKKKNLYFAYNILNNNLIYLSILYFWKHKVCIHFNQLCFSMSSVSTWIAYTMLYYTYMAWHRYTLRPALMPPPTIDYYCYYSESVRTIYSIYIMYIFSVGIRIWLYCSIPRLEYQNLRRPAPLRAGCVQNIMTRWFHTIFFSPVNARCNTLCPRRLGNTYKYNIIYVNIVSL